MSNFKIYKIVEKKYLWFLLSSLIVIIGFGFAVYRFAAQKPVLNFGIDFTGGMSLMMKFDNFEQDINKVKQTGGDVKAEQIKFIGKIRGTLKEFKLDKSRIQITQDNEVIITTSELDVATRAKILEAFSTKLGNNILLESNKIGASIGSELKEKSLWLIFFVTCALFVYITWRFEFSYGLGAMASLVHDSLIIIAAASIFFIQIDTEFVAALLTILGYSLNDTIVIFDRVRENVKEAKKGFNMPLLINTSIRQVLRRTINTSVVTIFFVSALIIFGGSTIKSFSTVLFIGIVTGTYSSYFIACPILDMFLPKKTA